MIKIKIARYVLLIVAVFFITNISQQIISQKVLSQPIAKQLSKKVTLEQITEKQDVKKDSQKISQTKIVTENYSGSYSESYYRVVKVVDGDTIDVLINNKVERLRLIGINTPETVDSRKLVECFGKEASDKAKSLLSGKQVSLKNDSSQSDRDKYGRLLRYVFLEDGTNFNLLMIKEGYAYEYTYRVPYQYQLEFKQAQQEAMSKKFGLWGDVCN